MPFGYEKHSHGYEGKRRRRRRRTTAEKLAPGPKAKRAARHATPPRRSGGTSGNLTLPEYTPETPVSSTPYRPSEPPTRVQRQIRRERAAPKTTLPFRSTLGGLGLGLENPINPVEAGQQALIGGEHLTDAQRDYIRAISGKPTVNAIEHLRNLHQRSEEQLGEPEDLTNAILAATGIGDIYSLLGRGAGKDLLGAITGTAAKDAAKGAEEQTARGAIRNAFAKVEPDAAQEARARAKQFAHNFADRTPEPVKVAAKVGARAASYPVRHPITSPILAQVPLAATSRNPKALEAGFTGHGAYANLTNALSGTLSHVSPVLGEAVSLPAAVLPSAYMAGKAGVEAAQGDSSDLHKLLHQYGETGTIGGLVSGGPGKGLRNLGEHPLFGALELSGALNAAGRVAGAGARALPGELGETTREPIPIKGTNLKVEREYSRDLLRQALQRAYDKTEQGRQIRPDTMRGRHHLKEAANRFTAGEEQIRREHARQDLKALHKSLPKKHLRVDRHSADVVNLAVERLIQKPESFHGDLAHYKTMLEEARKARTEDGKPALNKTELKANADLIKQIDHAMKSGDAGAVVDAADSFIGLQQPILDELVDLKLLSPEQAAKASAISFARVHLGAQHGAPPDLGDRLADVTDQMRQAAAKGDKETQGRLLAKLNRLQDEKQLLDKHGNPLSLEQISAEMRDRGIEPPGFISHRSPANSDFFQPFFGGSGLEKGARTGKAVSEGTQLGGVESLVRQLRRSRGLVDRAKAWHKAVNRFGTKVDGVDTMADAKRVMQDPERYGLDPSAKPTPVLRYPFTAKKNEIEGALEHQNPEVAGEGFTAALGSALKDAEAGSLPDDAKIVFMPQKVVEQLRKDAEPSPTTLKGAQAATTAFKRAVLPFSPSFFIGNGLDNAMRTVLAGINPAHVAIGLKAQKALNDEERVQLLAGAHFSSVDRLAPHRSVEQIVKGEDALSKGVRRFAEWSHKHGWKQAAVKFAPQLISRMSHLLLAGNAAVTESLPQYGALGKIILKETRKTQGSWSKAIKNLDDGIQEFAKGVEHPEKMIQAQKALEETYGNYSRMSPDARRFLSTVTPFWTWMRAAYKFVYLTMPAHHSVMTGLLASAANATRAEREQLGLARGEAPEQVPSYYNGIPLPDGGVFPLANYNSFDYASDPLEALTNVAVPQVRNLTEALAGRTWTGDEIKGNQNRVKAALWAAAGTFIPLVNDLTGETEEGQRKIEPHLSLPHPVSKEKVEASREPWETFSEPVGESSSSDESGAGSWAESFAESWADRGESSAGKSFAEAWADR